MKQAYEFKKLSAAKLDIIEQADAIITDFKARGYTLSLRQLYYQFVARAIIPNTERSYKNLGSAVSDGRENGLIDWLGIEDRGRAVVPWLIQENEQEIFNGVEYGLSLDRWQRQGTYVEVWVEKDALSSVVENACRQYAVPFLACKGYLSASEAWRAGQRFARKRGRRAVMIHLGDHDPSGIDMTRDNDDRLRRYAGTQVEVRRIALNRDQIDQYNPPPNPAKLSDSRASEYVATHGYQSWELDALSPEVTQDLISSEIESLIDFSIWEDTMREQRQRRDKLARIYENWGEVDALLDQLGDE